MEQLEPDNILKSLDAMSEQIGKAEDLVSNGEDLAALQMISEIKKSIRQVVVTIIMLCLQKDLEATGSEDQLSYEMRLRNFFKFLSFVLLVLCLNYQQQIWSKLMGV